MNQGWIHINFHNFSIVLRIILSLVSDKMEIIFFHLDVILILPKHRFSTKIKHG
jgi:hypothetical protein